MADEDSVFDRNPFTDEGVTRNLTPFTNGNAFLDFDKGANPRFITDFAAIKIDERMNSYLPAELHIRCDQLMRIHDILHGYRT